MSEPRLTVVIGANGAGKTTWSRKHRETLPKPFYNADSIAEGLGDANDAALQRRRGHWRTVPVPETPMRSLTPVHRIGGTQASPAGEPGRRGLIPALAA